MDVVIHLRKRLAQADVRLAQHFQNRHGIGVGFGKASRIGILVGADDLTIEQIVLVLLEPLD